MQHECAGKSVESFAVFGGRNFFPQRSVLRIGDDSRDFARRLERPAWAKSSEDFADRVFAGEKVTNESLIDDGVQWRLREFSPTFAPGGLFRVFSP
jgi:hypothetical protein